MKDNKIIDLILDAHSVLLHINYSFRYPLRFHNNVMLIDSFSTVVVFSSNNF